MSRPKRKTPKPRLTLQVEPEDQKKLQAIALKLRFITPAGSDAGNGSISALVTAIAEQQKLKLVKNMAIDGNPTRIYSSDSGLSFIGDRLATRKEYELADRCEGSIFESLNPSENIQLEDGYFILDEELDLFQDWQII